MLIRSVASVLSVCVPTRLVICCTALLAVLLGLAIQFSKSELRYYDFFISAATSFLVGAVCIFYIVFGGLCNFFFAAPLIPFCFALDPFPGRGRQLLHPLPEVRQGLVLFVFRKHRGAKPGEERPCNQAGKSALERLGVSLVSELRSRTLIR